MTRLLWMLLPLLAPIAAAGIAVAAEFYPTPEFEDHPIPISVPSDPDSVQWQALDAAALLGALSLATYFVLVNRSRRGLFLLTIASLIWFGFVRKGCICPIGSIQNVAWAVFDPTYSIPAVAVFFFALPLIFTLFFGRTFCAAVCPLGAVQELVAIRPIRVPRWLDQALGLFPFVYLGIAVAAAATGTAFLICRYDPYVAFFRLGGSVNMLIFGGCMLLIGLFVGRPYCRYLCPYGAVLGLLSKVSKRHASITPTDCIQCRLCEDVCPYEAIREPTVARPADQRGPMRVRLVLTLALLPVLVGLGACLGYLSGVPLARLHPDVRLEEQIQLEELGLATETTDQIDAFRETGRPVESLYKDADQVRGHFHTVGIWLGAWVGLVLGVKLVQLSIRRRRDDYETDRGKCVSCSRCYWYCPHEQLRLGIIQDVSELVDMEGLRTKD